MDKNVKENERLLCTKTGKRREKNTYIYTEVV
jgi:hypothetical protein